MKILYLLTQDLESPSGLGRYWPLARELAGRGHQVTVAALHPDYEALPHKRFHQEGVDIWYVAPMHVRKAGAVKTYYPTYRLLALMLRATWRLSQAAISTPADIVHIGKPHPMNSLAGLAGRWLAGKRLLLDCDDYEAGVGNFPRAWQRNIVAWFENWMPFRVRQVTTNTHFNRQRMLSLDLPADRIRYLSNGVDRQRFPPPSQVELDRLRSVLNLGGKQIVAFIGSLSRPGHPVELLFEAFQQVHHQLPGAVLLVVGGGDDYQRLKEMAAEIGLSQSIYFTGRVPPAEVVSYYHLADVSVDPVLDDGAAWGRSPLKLFETWACGTPFICSPVGDRADLLGDPPAGILVPPGDAPALAEGIVALLTNPSLANELKQRGLERVQDYYWEHLAGELEALYQMLITR